MFANEKTFYNFFFVRAKARNHAGCKPAPRVDDKPQFEIKINKKSLSQQTC